MENRNKASECQVATRPAVEGRGDKRTPRAPQEASRGFKTFPRAPQEAPKTAPTSCKKAAKMLETADIVRIDGSQRPCPKSQHKKGGRAAVIPLGEVNPPPAPEGWKPGVSDK